MKASWNNAAVMRPAAAPRRYKPSMLTNHVPGTAVKPRGHIPLDREPLPFREPQALDADGARWFAVRTSHARERPLQIELEAIGLRAYCPLVTKWAWKHGRRTKDKRQTPVFSRYIFAGCGPGQYVSRHTADGIEAVLGSYDSPIVIPPAALRAINALELAGEWDETRSWEEKTPFQPNRRVVVRGGAFADLDGLVDVAMSEDRIRVLISMFNQPVPVEIDACNLEPV